MAVDRQQLALLRALSKQRRQSDDLKLSTAERLLYRALRDLLVRFPTEKREVPATATLQLKSFIALFGQQTDSEEVRVDIVLAAVIDVIPERHTKRRTQWTEILQGDRALEKRMRTAALDTERNAKSRLVFEFAKLLYAAVERRLLELPTADSVSPADSTLITNIDWLPQTMFYGYAEQVEMAQFHLAEERRVVIVGDGGMGKSTIAVELFRRLRQQFDVIWRVDCASPETAGAGFRELSEALQINSITSDLQRSVREWLVASSLRWALVLDNLKSPEAFNQYAPVSSGAVVGTSRVRKGWTGRAEVVALKGLNPDAARDMLLRSSGLKSNELADSVARDVRYMPLALSYLGRLAEYDGLDRVYARLQSRLTLSPPELQHAIPPAFAASIFEQLDEVKGSQAWVASFLGTLAMLRWERIPRWFVDNSCYDGVDYLCPHRREFHERTAAYNAYALREIEKRGLADVSEDTVTIHPVVSSIILEWVATQGLERTMIRAAVTWVGLAQEAQKPVDSYESWSRLSSLRNGLLGYLIERFNVVSHGTTLTEAIHRGHVASTLIETLLDEYDSIFYLSPESRAAGLVQKPIEHQEAVVAAAEEMRREYADDPSFQGESLRISTIRYVPCQCFEERAT